MSLNFTNSSSSGSTTVHWLDGKPAYNFGTTFGLPWPEGQYPSNFTKFTASTSSNKEIELDSWVTGQWADGSVKWTGHAIPASENIDDAYTVTAQKTPSLVTKPRHQQRAINSTGSLIVTDASTSVTVSTGKLAVSFPKSGSILIGTIKTTSGKTIGTNGRLVLQSQSGVADNSDSRGNSSIKYFNFGSSIQDISVDSDSVRALVTVNGIHQVADGGVHDDWLPFVLRFYLYANSDSIRLVHSLVFDAAADQNFITGVGIRFGVPLAGEEYYNRHVRIAGVDGGLLNEAVQGITGLRRDPGATVRTAQYDGAKLANISTWSTKVSAAIQWIPTFGDYSLSQISPDGFTLKKRTKAGQGWIKIPGGTRAGGLAYLGMFRTYTASSSLSMLT